MNLLAPLLSLYPREWRARYEDEFTALLEQNRLSPLDVLDIMLGALDAHRRPQVAASQVPSERRISVNRVSFIKWSGMAGMVGSVLAFTGMLSTFMVADSEVYLFDGWDIAARATFVSGVVLTIVFAAGFLMSHGRRLGVVGQLGLLIAFAGLLSLAYSTSRAVAEAVRGYDVGGWWDFFIWGLLGTLTGSAIFGAVGLVQRVLPATAAGTTTLGALATIAILALSMGVGLDASTGSTAAVLLQGAALVSFACFKLGLLLLGYSLWTGRATGAARIDPATIG